MSTPAKFSGTNPRLFCLIIGGVFCALLLVERLAPVVLSLDAFFFRPWEYMTGAYRYNAPRTSMTMTLEGYGDLSNILGTPQFRVPRQYVWTNDAYGFRNSFATQHEYPEILVVGDSFMTSAADNDDDTFVEQLRKRTGKRVSGYVPANMSEFLADPRFHVNVPPVVLWGRVERNLLGDDGEMQTLLKDSTCFRNSKESRDALSTLKEKVKSSVGPFKEYATLSIFRRTARQLLAQAVFAITGEYDSQVQIAEDGSGILFFAKGIRLLGRSSDDRDMKSVAQAVAHVRDCLAERGSTLLFLPIPDKEHVYAEKVKAESASANVFEDFSAHLRSQNVTFVDLWPVFAGYAQEEQELLYWPDDTHWNAKGISVAVEEVTKKLR